MSELAPSNRVRAAVRAFLSDRLSDSENDEGGHEDDRREAAHAESDDEGALFTNAAPRPSRYALADEYSEGW
jgi:hypothetical protein